MINFQSGKISSNNISLTFTSNIVIITTITTSSGDITDRIWMNWK
jgi:hypothetical protein